MTAIYAYDTSGPRLTRLVMFLVAISIAAMIIATQPFDPGSVMDRLGWEPSGATTTAIPRPQLTDWCCLGSKPAERPGRGITDVDEVTSPVDKIPRRSPLVVEAVGLDAAMTSETSTNR